MMKKLIMFYILSSKLQMLQMYYVIIAFSLNLIVIIKFNILSYNQKNSNQTVLMT